MRIIQDTREKEGFGWAFGNIDVIERKLETGDYSIEGMEDRICIERKASPSEIAINVGIDSKRFEKELERMKKFEFKYLVFEFSLSSLLSFPQNSDIPKSKLSQIKLNGRAILKILSEYQKKYGIEIIYAKDRDGAIARVLEIFEIVESL